MNLVTQRTTWANWQFGLLKLAMLSVGVLFGVYFADFWKPLLPLVWGVAAVTIIWSLACDRSGKLPQDSPP